jgi:hypothetical protein
MANLDNVKQASANDTQEGTLPINSTHKVNSLRLLIDTKSTCYDIIESCDRNKTEKATSQFGNLCDLQDQIDDEDILELSKREMVELVNILNFINEASKEFILKGFYRNSGSQLF